jgi:hypothetical protein
MGRIKVLDKLFNDKEVLKSIIFSNNYKTDDYRIILVEFENLFKFLFQK